MAQGRRMKTIQPMRLIVPGSRIHELTLRDLQTRYLRSVIFFSFGDMGSSVRAGWAYLHFHGPACVV
jgi:hypothetical protein